MDPTTEWMYNICSSIVIITVNKFLMDHHGFSFATMLTGLHFATISLVTALRRWDGSIQPSCLPFPELLIYVLFANFSAVGMNVSLMWNSLGFYQAAKVGIIPVTLLLETVFDKIQYSPLTRSFITIVVYGVSICSLIGVSGVSVDAKGFVAAFIAVWSTSLQQYYINFLQRKFSLSSCYLIGQAAPMQAASMLLLGPFLDYWLTNKRIDAFEFNKEIMVLIILSCLMGAGHNLSQFIFIERFTPISYQVFGQIETLLILIFLNFEGGFNFLLVISMIFSFWGLIMYFGVTLEEPGWRSYSIPKSSQQKHGEVSYSSKLDDKV